ncbi:IS3 family transposase [Flavobacterium panacagri]|uniref:IS3 family transposase n=1 Tax=Flavobacterium panacagri TaxID=3034146 RepID=UPI0025A5F72D|nr:IS3 family transposase [Flavobacterium panacagri]
MKKRLKTYDRLFKEKAIQLISEKGVAEAAKDLEMTQSMLFRWRLEYERFGVTSFCGKGRGHVRLNPEQRKIKELTRKIKITQQKLEILKNGSKYVLQGRLIAFQYIKDNEKVYWIKTMCKVLRIDIASYYRWKRQFVSKAKERNNLLKEEIKSIFFEFKQRHGTNTITSELQKRGYTVSRSTVGKYLVKLDLHFKQKKKFKITTNSNHNHFLAPNILNRKFKVKEPSKAWVSDITYIRIQGGFMYLTIILDLFDRKIIGWNLSSSLSTINTILPAWDMAVSNRKITNELIFHSDRGAQYSNKIFMERLSSNKNIVRSMNRQGNCWDNIIAEAFFSILKKELIYINTLFTKEQLKAEIFEFIENWYNKKRRHSFLKYKTIEEFDKLKNVI